MMGLSVRFYIQKNNIFIRLIGELDQENIGNLRDKLIDIIKERNIKNVVFNMKELTFMDSTGIGIIIGRYNQIKQRNGRVILCNINNAVQKIILLSGLARICLIKDTEDDAKTFLEENKCITN